MDINPISATSIPPEVYEAAFNVAQQRLVMLGTSVFKTWQLRKETKRVLREAELWPLARCVDIFPFVGQVDNGHVSGLFDDGRLRCVLVIVWMAPFPGHTVRLDCQLTVPPDGPQTNQRPILYTVRNHKVTAERDGQPEQIEGGSIKLVELDLLPDTAPCPGDIGPAHAQERNGKCGRLVAVTGLQISAHAPWRCVRDTENRPAFSFWIPRW